MSLTRRQLLQASAATGAAAFLSGGRLPRRGSPPLIWKFVDELWVPPFVDGTEELDLALVSAQHQFHSSLAPADTLAYRAAGGTNTYLGPTLVVPTGHGVTVRATNDIGVHPLSVGPGKPPTATHLHGGNSRPEHDGLPDDTFMQERTYVYDNNQDAAGLWYHDAALGMSRLNVYAGLAGAYLVRDIAVTGIDTGRGDFLPPPPYEIPLFLQDKTFRDDGTLSYPGAWVPEFFGDVPVVNGTAYPFLVVDRGVYRFRVYNASNARFYRLSLEPKPGNDRLRFLQIGTDGGLLNAAVAMTGLVLAPGERADLLVDFRDLPGGAVVQLTNDAPAPYPSGARPGHRGGAPLPSIMQFRVVSRAGWRPSARQPLENMNLRPVTPVERLDLPAASARVRSHSLVEMANLVGQPTMVTLDNQTFASGAYTRVPASRDAVEVWELVNTTPETQPVHLHLVQFQVLNRQPLDVTGYLQNYADASPLLLPNMPPYPAPSPTPHLNGRAQPPAANETGWKDTVQAPPGMVTRIVVPFGRAAVDAPVAARDAHPGDYVWSCQILEHQDNDMVQRYRVS
jgi:spore coat protein A